jgi:uncharacterized protein
MIKNKLTFLLFIISISCSGQADKNALRIATIPQALSWDGKPLNYKTEGNTITVTAGKETDLYCFVDGNYYVNTAPKVLFTPDSNFVLSAKISPTFQTMYDGGAIMIYSDEGNWAKLLFERHEDGSIGLGSSIVRDKRGDDSYHLTFKDPQVYVKLARSEMIFNFYYSTDGKQWKLLRTFPYKQFSNLRIGFYAQSPKGQSCTVLFSDIRYKGEKFKDYFTGE